MGNETLISPEKPLGQSQPTRKLRVTIIVGIIMSLVMGLVIGYFVGGFPISGYRKQVTSLQNELQYQQQKYNTLTRNFQNLQQDYDDLQEKYSKLVSEYEGALKVPYTTIQEGDVVWAFKSLTSKIVEWSMPLDTYIYYVNNPKPTEYHYLTTDGKSFSVRNMELFVQPDFFSNVIHDLTYGNTARDFVQEVFNLRVQLTLYNKDITDTPQWSAETMTKGTGDCEDLAILMASLLLAGNKQANYNMKIQMVYMDSENPTNPQTVNHVLLYVVYSDGAGQFVDSTSINVLSPWSRVVGWYYDLT
jgi:hypothetical protein